MTTAGALHRVVAPARLVIVDDHEIARAGLRSMLSGAAGLEVVGEAADGYEAVAICRALRPNLALVDVRMPGLNGLDTTTAIKRENASIAVIIVTMYDNPDYVVEALKVGAAGYVLKDATRRELLTTVRRVLAGESILNSELATRLLSGIVADASNQASPVEQLTVREREVLRLLAQGQTNREIAHDLIVSVGTVKIHVEHIIAKLGVSDRTQAAVRGVQLGLIDARPA